MPAPARPKKKPIPLTKEQQDLAASCMGIAGKQATRFFRNGAGTMPYDELRGEAMFGLVIAARTYKPDQGVPFGLWAHMAVRHRLIWAMRVWRRDGVMDHVRYSEILTEENRNFLEASDKEQDPAEQCAVNELLNTIQEMMPTRWFQMLCMHFSEKHTLQEIGHKYGVTRERARQLIQKGLHRVAQSQKFQFQEQA